jgi:hypothetical protein
VLLASLMKNLSTNYTKKNLFEFHEKTQLNQAIGLMRLAVGCWLPSAAMAWATAASFWLFCRRF